MNMLAWLFTLGRCQSLYRIDIKMQKINYFLHNFLPFSGHLIAEGICSKLSKPRGLHDGFSDCHPKWINTCQFQNVSSFLARPKLLLKWLVLLWQRSDWLCHCPFSWDSPLDIPLRLNFHPWYHILQSRFRFFILSKAYFRLLFLHCDWLLLCFIFPLRKFYFKLCN